MTPSFYIMAYLVMGAVFVTLINDGSFGFIWHDDPSLLDQLLAGVLWPIVLLAVVLKGRE
jgi:hypothetical protein